MITTKVESPVRVSSSWKLMIKCYFEVGSNKDCWVERKMNWLRKFFQNKSRRKKFPILMILMQRKFFVPIRFHRLYKGIKQLDSNNCAELAIKNYDEHVMSWHNKQIWSTPAVPSQLGYEHNILLWFRIMVMMMKKISLIARNKRLMIHPLDDNSMSSLLFIEMH